MQGLRALAMHAGAIAVLGWFITIADGWLMFFLMLLQGIFLVFLFTLQHETTHYTPFKTRILNTIAGQCCGLILLLPPMWFRHFHLAHHRWTQDPQRDPELASSKPTNFYQYAVYLSGLPVWKSNISTILRNAFQGCEDNFVPISKQRIVRLESLTMLGLYLFIAIGAFASGFIELFYIWIVPLLLGQPFLRAYLLAEHAGCSEVNNRFANTRTLVSNPIVRMIAWNMPYHTEHHVYPAVPFFRLPDAHVLVRQHLMQLEPGYRSFHRKYIAAINH